MSGSLQTATLCPKCTARSAVGHWNDKWLCWFELNADYAAAQMTRVYQSQHVVKTCLRDRVEMLRKGMATDVVQEKRDLNP